MEKTSGGKIILLLDYFNRGSQDLIVSFKNAKLDFQAVVINDEGFLPDGVINVFEYFLGDFKETDCPGKPLYFNQISVPDYWEIGGTNTSASVRDKDRERARIFYAEPKNKRLVKVVDWIDESGVVRVSEHYNRYGCKYAITSFNKKGQKVTKTFFDGKGREIIVENFVTTDIILNFEGKTFIFKNRTEFLSFFIKRMGWESNRIFFNSLSTPFFVSNALPASQSKDDILFWQEPTGNEIPGNMSFIFKNEAGRCGRVIVQNHPSYQKLLKLGAPKDKISELGFIYSFKKENLGRPEALICTNTENVEKLAELMEAFPEVKFHVTALTEMSGKLLSHERFENAIMYPNIKITTLMRLFVQCDFFLDINHEGEIVEATRNAFMHNQLILAFNETSHSKEYTDPSNVFGAKDYKLLIKKFKEVLADKDALAKAMDAQRAHGLAASVEDYTF